MFDAIKAVIFFFRELDFIKRQEAERKKIEDLEKAHVVEVQGLQVRVSECRSRENNRVVLPSTGGGVLGSRFRNGFFFFSLSLSDQRFGG